MNPITIVGGGLAGLTLGIGLRSQGVPVSIWEAGRYPRHRVCGEFISGRGLDTLRRLGLEERLIKAGGRHARTLRFATATAAAPIQTLPEPALCLSRHILDALLAEEFCRQGGELRPGERWLGSTDGAGMVRASGRQAQPVAGGWRWFGLKAHARKASLSADLEMHLFPDGYVGLCQLPGDEVNVCGLFRRRAPAGELPGRWHEWLRGVPGSPLRDSLSGATFDPDTFCSIAGLSLRPRRAAARTECCVGDALTMIPPVTGNGMSMAFESAEIAREPLVQFSRDDVSWAEARDRIAQQCDHAFARRLRWAGGLQYCLFQPTLQAALFFIAIRHGILWRELFARTR